MRWKLKTQCRLGKTDSLATVGAVGNDHNGSIAHVAAAAERRKGTKNGQTTDKDASMKMETHKPGTISTSAKHPTKNCPNATRQVATVTTSGDLVADTLPLPLEHLQPPARGSTPRPPYREQLALPPPLPSGNACAW